jgi:hypothetical protein
MLLNSAVAAAYVLVGSFRGLLSFKGTHFLACVCTYSIADRLSTAMTELSVFVATIGGVFVLRSRPADPDLGPAGGHYQTLTINLVIFCSIGSLIVIRSAIAHIFQVLIIAALFGAGSIIYRSTWWQTIARTTLTAGG